MTVYRQNNFDTYWLSTLRRWTNGDFINYALAPGDLMFYEPTPGERRQYYECAGVSWVTITRVQYIAKGGVFPEAESTGQLLEALKGPEYNTKPLGALLTTPELWRQLGGHMAPVPNGWAFIDRFGNTWEGATGEKWRLKKTASGEVWISTFLKQKFTDGQIARHNTLLAEGLVYVRDNTTGMKNFVHHTAKLLFAPKGDYNYAYVPTEPSDWEPLKVGYITSTQAMIWGNNVLVCRACHRPFYVTEPKKEEICYEHQICWDCMKTGEHRHCQRCGRGIDNNQPAIPQPDPYGPHRSCKDCGLCFRCTSECRYCPPVKGRYVCHSCCKGEHYKEEEDDAEAAAYILPYDYASYPTPRPPFPAPSKTTLCMSCQGSGIFYINHAAQNCETCGGSGRAKKTKEEPVQLWMGVELEVEVPKGLLRAAKTMRENWLKDVIIKRDSTIRHGFEVVTGPFSLEEHTKLWPNLTRELVKLGCRSWNYTNTGLHIHCNWQFLSQMELCMYNVFVNEPAVKKQIIKIAGRESVYAALKPKTIEQGKTSQAVPHREALNITTHRGKTFELRIFKGTIAVEHIMADLQFVHSSVHWIKKAHVDELNKWGPYWEYVKDHKETYPDLIEHFNRQIAIEQEKSKENAA